MLSSLQLTVFASAHIRSSQHSQMHKVSWVPSKASAGRDLGLSWSSERDSLLRSPEHTMVDLPSYTRHKNAGSVYDLK